MTGSKVLRIAILFVMSSVFIFSPAVQAAAHPATTSVILWSIGHPKWKPVDFNEFAAPIGTADEGYDRFFTLMGRILPPPNHLPNEALGYGGIGPGAPHPPPYTHEISDGLAPMGFHHGIRFSQSEFSNGMGVYIAWMTVPYHGSTGSSPDYDSGPIIPNSLFPIHITGVTYHNGELFNQWLVDVTVPPTTEMTPVFNTNVDGHSHFPMWVADNADFGPSGTDLRGTYHYSIDMVDSSGNGWHMNVFFTVRR
jgi:hypothetical protein